MRDVVRIARWRRAIRGAQRYHPSHSGFWPLLARLRVAAPPTSSNGDFVAVILVHQRPANLDLQVRAALHAPAIGEVIVSCNKPSVRIEEWLTVASPRLRVHTEEGRNQTRRYALALESGADRFVLPDDDVLFTPEAIDAFCHELARDPANPIGAAGQRLAASGVWESGITAPGEEVDVLNRAYACTRAHAEAVFRNATLLGWSEEDTFANPADDVLVSFAGASCPRVVSLPHVNCVSHDNATVSTFLQPGFHAARAEWVAALRTATGRAPARRDKGDLGAVASVGGMARVASVATQPLRRRFYAGHNVRSLGRLPATARRAAGLDDYGAMVAQRLQIGLQPAPLRGFVRLSDHASSPHVTLRAPHWAPNAHRLFATEIVAFGVLDALPPALVPMALASWRSMIGDGGRLIVGVADSSAVLAERDATLGAPSWGSQLPEASAVLTSPLQLAGDSLETTLWDAPRLRDAVQAQGFEVVATVTDGSEIERAPGVAPWPVVTSRGERPLFPVPAALDGAADIVVVARAR